MMRHIVRYWCRAEKFGVDFKEPAKVRKDLRTGARKERMTREGFATGIEFLSPVSAHLAERVNLALRDVGW
jgi:hypothetical protein